MKKFNRKLFRVKEQVFLKDEFDIFFDEASGIAKTDVAKCADLDKFNSAKDYLPYSRGKLKSINLLYAFSRALMFRYKFRKIRKHLLHESKILDVGCGTGDFLLYMKKKKNIVFGTEKSKIARERCLSKGLRVSSSLKGIKETRFQAITLWHVLEHLQDPSTRLSEYYQRLDKKGVLIIAVPNLKSHDAQYYKQHWAALDVPRHLWHFTPKGLIKLVEKKGFIIQKTFPLWLDVLYISFLSEKNLSKKLPFLRGILKGLYFHLLSLKTKKYSSLVFVFRKAAQ